MVCRNETPDQWFLTGVPRHTRVPWHSVKGVASYHFYWTLDLFQLLGVSPNIGIAIQNVPRDRKRLRSTALDKETFQLTCQDPILLTRCPNGLWWMWQSLNASPRISIYAEKVNCLLIFQMKGNYEWSNIK